MVTSRRTLLLNATYEPLAFITDIDAIVLMVKGKVDVLSTWAEKICTTTKSFSIPATVILKERVRRPNRPPRFTRRVLFNRDGWQCVYCGRQLTIAEATVDHVNPRAQGGRTSWMNCVTSCKPCNKRKADRLLSECGMTLEALPKTPSPYHMWERVKVEDFHPDWEVYYPQR